MSRTPCHMHVTWHHLLHIEMIGTGVFEIKPNSRVALYSLSPLSID